MAGELRARHSSLCSRRSDRRARAGSREGPRELSMQPLNKEVMSLKSSAHPGLGVFLCSCYFWFQFGMAVMKKKKKKNLDIISCSSTLSNICAIKYLNVDRPLNHVVSGA